MIRELRIGNYVNYIVQDNLDERKEWFEVSIIDAADLAVLEKNPSDECYQRIPLTEEWLVKLKAIKLDDCFFYTRFKLFFLPNYGYWYVADAETNCYMTKVEFVHEWQNFVYVMNDTELTLNP